MTVIELKSLHFKFTKNSSVAEKNCLKISMQSSDVKMIPEVPKVKIILTLEDHLDFGGSS